MPLVGVASVLAVLLHRHRVEVHKVVLAHQVARVALLLAIALVVLDVRDVHANLSAFVHLEERRSIEQEAARVHEIVGIRQFFLLVTKGVETNVVNVLFEVCLPLYLSAYKKSVAKV